MPCKIRHFLSLATIKSIYYAIFHFHLSLVHTAYGKNLNSKHRIDLLQKKAMRTISFSSFDAQKLPIFAKLNIIKFPDGVFHGAVSKKRFLMTIYVIYYILNSK